MRTFYIKDSYSESDIKSMFYALNNSVCDYDSYIKAELLSHTFMGVRSIHFNDSMNGLACIDLKFNCIYINPDMIFKSLQAALPAVLSNLDVFPFLKYSYYGRQVFSLDTYVSMFSCYLILHEVGHYLYTKSDVNDLISSVCLQYGIPREFAFFVHNVVEDAFIQRRLQLDYPVQIYRDTFLLGTTIIQGPIAVANFLTALKEGNALSLYNKLFYFILRAYNLDDKDVQSMWNMNPAIGWTQEALDLFDKAIIILDSSYRAEVTFTELLPVLFDIVHEVVDVSGSPSNSSGSLLESDKLYEANQTNPKQPSNSQDESEKSASQNKAENSAKNESSNSDEQVNEEEANSQNLQENEPNSTELNEEDKSDTSDSSNAIDSNELESDSEEGDASNEEDSKEDSEGESSSKDNSGFGSSSSNDTGMTEEEFLKRLSEVCNELNQALDELDKSREEAVSVNPVDAADAADALSGIEKLEQPSLSSIVDDVSKYTSNFSTSGLQLYNVSSALFKRIFNFESEDLNYLDSGDIDEDTMIDFYTEKSLNIFKQHIDLVESKNIFISFVVDDSGSMYDRRARALRSIIPPLIHAFEDSDIKCSLYTFSDCYKLVKDFDDPAIFINGRSNVQALFNSVCDCGGTSIGPVLTSLCSREYDTDNNIYIVFTFTDGCFDDESLVKGLYQHLRDNLHVFLYGVTIDSFYDCERLSDLMYGVDSIPLVQNYSTDELVTRLPEDIYNTIVNTFIKLK